MKYIIMKFSPRSLAMLTLFG